MTARQENGDTLLVLITGRHRRDDIVDALMANARIGGFSVSAIAGFSRAHSHFNLRERVQGFGDYERFEVICSAGTARALLDELAELIGADHLRYWLQPLTESGSLGG